MATMATVNAIYVRQNMINMDIDGKCVVAHLFVSETPTSIFFLLSAKNLVL